ncbi:MAG: tsaA [Verrucomicrobiaceae bacterium]|nr:tsaA [Verrucomicrobiaceae bacterium]
MTFPQNFSLDAIGVVHSPFKEKFGIPRQPGLAQTPAVIELLPPYAVADAVKGLDTFSHIWITFIFHGISTQEWKPLVRPPRLGGNEKIGVFATRSTHRPNPIGLSVVRLEKIEIAQGVKLYIRGADLLDGTPVLDIKPYLPYADVIADARAGFAQKLPERLRVRWHSSARDVAQDISTDSCAMIEDVLAFDPRPAYQDEPLRIYGMHIDKYNVRFRIDEHGVEIVGIEAVISEIR